MSEGNNKVIINRTINNLYGVNNRLKEQLLQSKYDGLNNKIKNLKEILKYQDDRCHNYKLENPNINSAHLNKKSIELLTTCNKLDNDIKEICKKIKKLKNNRE